MSSARLALMMIVPMSCAARAKRLAGKIAPHLRFTLWSRTRGGFVGFHSEFSGAVCSGSIVVVLLRSSRFFATKTI